jgi:hypothetical protein
VSITASKTIWALLGACTLLACGGPDDQLAPPAIARTERAPEQAHASDAPAQAALPDTRRRVGEGVLNVFVGTTLTSYLGGVQAVVEDRDGNVVVGSVSEVAQPEDAHDYQLSLPLRAGDDYWLSLSATTVEEHPTACTASVGPFDIGAGSTAQVQTLAWVCGDTIGYLPAALGNDCYWAAEWTFIGRASASVGELIDVSASGHDTNGNLARFEWSTAMPEHGHFAEPHAHATSFRCQAAGIDLPLSVSITAGDCEQTLTRTVTCLDPASPVQ